MRLENGTEDQDSHHSIIDSMIAFAQTAADGGFEVNEAGGERMIAALDHFDKWIDSESHQLGILEQERRLGGSNAAKVMAPYTQQVVVDEQGFVTQLKVLRESLKKAREGLLTAMENYRRTEESTGSHLRNIDA